MMIWNRVTGRWGEVVGQFMQRFPLADAVQVRVNGDSPEALARHVAEAHDLTELEAREDMLDWMMIQGLARDASAVGLDDCA